MTPPCPLRCAGCYVHFSPPLLACRCLPLLPLALLPLPTSAACRPASRAYTPESASLPPCPCADYCAAALIDRPWCGRMRMQAGGFLLLFLLFLLQGALYTTLAANSGAFQVGAGI